MGEPQRVPVNIMGTSFRPGAGELISRMRAGVPLRLEREPTNKVDVNAIKVIAFNSQGQTFHLGYIGAQRAAILAPLMDAGMEIECTKAAVSGAAIILRYTLPDPVDPDFNRNIEL